MLDWDHFEEQGLPLLDWVIFLGRAYRQTVKRQMKNRGENPDKIKIHGYPEIFMDGLLNTFLVRYLDHLDMDSSILEPLLFMWWIKHMQDWKKQLIYNPEWRKMRLYPVMERLKILADVM